MASFFSTFTLLDRYVSEDLIVLRVASRHSGNPCPRCGQWTQRVHSAYYRTVQDVPIGGSQLILRVLSRKFFCDHPQCSQMIFTERFPGLLARSQQKTSRLNQMLTRIAFELGGNPGATFARQLGVVVSRDTMLARIRDTPISEPSDMEEIRVVGIDDWAYRRGLRYGTLICDLEHHRVIGVLPDRRVATVSEWLRRHPGIQMVSRDRASAYADAIRKGLPHAQQVADRWHLLKNLGDAVQRYLTRQPLPLQEMGDSSAPQQDHPSSTEKPTSPSPSRDRSRTARRQTKWRRVQEVQQLHQSGVGKREISRRTGLSRQTKWRRVQEVQQLHQSGVGKREISRRTGLSRQTISTYLTWTEVPQTTRAPRSTLLDPYRETVAELVRQSLTGSAILQRIREQGYKGSRTTLSHYLAACRRTLKSGEKPKTAHRRHRVSPRQAAMLLTRKEGQIDDRDKPYRDQLLQEVQGAKEIQGMCVSFHDLIETHDSARLGDWLEQALRSGIREMQSFASGIQTDLEAVVAGIRGPWCCRPVSMSGIESRSLAKSDGGRRQ
jgi:transposase